MSEKEYNGQIVVLDGYTANPGDLSWGPFLKLGGLKVYDRTPPALIKERAKGARALLTNKTMLDEKVLSSLSGVSYIGILATGINSVDTAAARKCGIAVTNVPAYSTDSVSQMVFAQILNYCNNVELYSRSVQKGEWGASKDFCFYKKPVIELSGKTMGIIGFGHIGKKTAKTAAAFGMRVLVFTRTPPGESRGIEFLPFQDLLRRSDFISLHCPLNNETCKIINRDSLSLMKPGAFLVNTGRGGLIDEEALACFLNEGRLAGAGLDVLEKEPPSEGSPLIGARGCRITPHIAWASVESRERLIEAAADNFAAFLEGREVNRVV